MRRLAVPACTLLIAAFALAPTASATRQEVRTVTVKILCNGEDLGSVSVEPYTVRISRSAGDQVEWVLTEDSQVSSIALRPKPGENARAWPFAAGAPAVSRGGRGRSGAVRPEAPGGAHPYDIMATCGQAPDRIDPEMEIDR